VKFREFSENLGSVGVVLVSFFCNYQIVVIESKV